MIKTFSQQEKTFYLSSKQLGALSMRKLLSPDFIWCFLYNFYFCVNRALDFHIDFSIKTSVVLLNRGI